MDNDTRNGETFDFELVTHEGTPLTPAANSRGTQRYMGALEENMQVVILPSYEDDEEDMPVLQAHKQQTPG